MLVLIVLLCAVEFVSVYIFRNLLLAVLDNAVKSSQGTHFIDGPAIVYSLWLSYMFWSLLGPSSGYCVKLLIVKVKAYTKYTLCV